LPAIAGALAPDAKLWAFEPNPDNYRCASITKLINALGNVELIEAGLDRDTGTAEFVTEIRGTVAGPRGWISTRPMYYVKDDIATATLPIQLTTIDATIPASRAVSVIHLTVEGNEPNALKGATATITRCKPLVVVRRQPNYEWPGALAAFGYRVSTAVEKNLVLVPTTS
jgi:FkbM family methyltransferase